jgi:hypothetical protein
MIQAMTDVRGIQQAAPLIWRAKTAPANVALAIGFGNRRILTHFALRNSRRP